MTGALTGDYLSLLIAIQENPLGTVDVFQKVTGKSKPTIAKRLQELQGSESLRVSGKKVPKQRYFTVKPLLNTGNMGLEYIDVVLGTETHNSLQKLEKLATTHPYTAYRGRCFGHHNGVHLQFRIPVGTRPFIEELVESLVDDGTVSNFQFFDGAICTSVHTSMRIEGWNSETMTWAFDWNKWFTKTSRKTTTKQTTPPLDRVPDWFTKKDVCILSELMNGARRKNLDIISSLKAGGVDITPQTFSRRYQLIRDECIDGFRVSFNPTAFDIYNNVLIFGDAESDYVDGLRDSLIKNPIPFESTLRTCNEHMYWSIRLQASHLSSLLSNLYSELDKMSVYLVDYTHTMVYLLWAEAFDDTSRKWRSDHKFMIEDVLEQL